MATGRVINQSLEEYFRQQLNEQAQHWEPPPQQDTLWYLGDMLTRFGHTDAVFVYDEGSLRLRPLALLYLDAREARSNRERYLLLRQLGDLALFFGALFPEVFYRKGLGRDYLIGMGGRAYEYLADNKRGPTHVFAELAQRFGHLLDLVAGACHKQTMFDADDILTLYQRWLRSGDPRLLERLQALGMVTASDSWQ